MAQPNIPKTEEHQSYKLKILNQTLKSWDKPLIIIQKYVKPKLKLWNLKTPQA